MQLIRFLFSISWLRIASVIIAGLVCGAANTFLVTLINGVVSKAGHPDVTVWQFAATGIVVLVGGILSQLLLIKLAQDAIYRLRADLSARVVAAPLEHLERLGSHRLIATLTEDVRSLSQSVTAIPAICVDLATIIGCLVYLGMLSGLLFVIVVAGTLLGIACVEAVLKRVRGLYHAARENEDGLISSFQAVTLGIKELKLHRGRRRDFMERHLLGTAADLRSQNVEAGTRFSWAQGLGQVVQLGTMALILFVIAKALGLPQDIMIGYVLVTTFLSMPMQNFTHLIPDLLRGDVALKKIRSMRLSMEGPGNEDLLPFTDRPAVTEARLTVDNLRYVYRTSPGPELHPPSPGGHPRHPGPGPDVNGAVLSGLGHPRPPMPLDDGPGFQLGPVNLAFDSGQISFIVGGNGSGKSTLGKLLSGLYVPQSGTVRLNGEIIDQHNVEWFRQNISAIFTDFHLFEDYLGFDAAEIEPAVQRYLHELQLANKVSIRDGKLSTIALSQGQRKRLALLTALLEDRQIYLFDEWAADQEPRFREVFYREILFDLRRRGKTVIVITHDDRYFDCADQLIKLDYGRVAEVSETQLVA